MRSLQVVAAMLSILLVAPVSSSRVEGDVTSEAPTPSFEFTIKKTLCSEPNFHALEGLVFRFPEAIAKIRQAGQKLANEKNCRLCDISGIDLSLHKATVTCTALGLNPTRRIEEQCLTSNGEVGWATAPRICMPCPKECGHCVDPDTTEQGFTSKLQHPGNKYFKCMYKIGFPSIPPPWKCDKPSQKKDYRWCAYRHDLLSTASMDVQTSDSDWSKWEVKIIATPCNDAATESSNKIVAGIMKTVGPNLQYQFNKQNCALCRIQARVTMENQIKAGATCADDDFGVSACRTDRGATGWNPENPCEPCPPECVSCKSKKNDFDRGFACKLHYTTPGKIQLDSLFVKSNPGEEDIHVKMPVGYHCNEPVKRECGKILKRFCKGYKTWCHSK